MTNYTTTPIFHRQRLENTLAFIKNMSFNKETFSRTFDLYLPLDSTLFEKHYENVKLSDISSRCLDIFKYEHLDPKTDTVSVELTGYLLTNVDDLSIDIEIESIYPHISDMSLAKHCNVVNNTVITSIDRKGRLSDSPSDILIRLKDFDEPILTSLDMLSFIDISKPVKVIIDQRFFNRNWFKKLSDQTFTPRIAYIANV